MSLRDTLRSALDVPSREDSASQVHDVVADAMRQLDPGIDVRATDYFAHSFVPDLVVRWGPAEQRKERHLHLRLNVSDAAFGQDLQFLSDDGPLFLGLLDNAPLHDAAWRHGPQADLRGTLVTQAVAVDGLSGRVDSDHRAQRATTEIVRDGRGDLDDVRAASLMTKYTAALNAIERFDEAEVDPLTETREALEALGAVLGTRGLSAVERTLQSFWIRHGGDPFEFPGSEPWRPDVLDHETLGEILNSLLDSEREVTAETWERNAGFLQADEIGRVLDRPRRGGLLNELVTALLSNWTAQTVWAERLPAPPLEETYEWVIDNKTLGIEVGDIRAFFADDGRRFKEKDRGHPLPRLDDTREILSDAAILAVGLRNPQEGLRYEVRGSQTTTVFDRLQAVLAEQRTASFQVESITAAVPGTGQAGEIDFDRQIVDLDKRPTPLRALARMAVKFFSRAGYGQDRLDDFLAGRDERT